jgi:tRNA A37 threonylcarbamoyltransferase TsaD
VDADVSMEDIDAIAVTEGPGLIGALLILLATSGTTPPNRL